MTTHDVVINGKIAPEEDTDAVASRLAEQFKISKEQATGLLAAPVVIKRDVDEPTAQRYQAALSRIGVRCEIRPKESLSLDAPIPIEPPPTPPPPPASPDGSLGSFIYCYGCGAQIHVSAATCPHCGAPARNTARLATPQQTLAMPTVAVSNVLIWILAFAPVIGWFMEGILAFTLHGDNEDVATAAWFGGSYWFVTLALNIVLSYADLTSLKKRGIETGFAKSMAWFVPVYLFRRAAALGQSKAYFVTWLICFGITLLIPFGA